MLYIGIDLGTSAVKLLLMTETGEIHSVSAISEDNAFFIIKMTSFFRKQTHSLYRYHKGNERNFPLYILVV